MTHSHKILCMDDDAQMRHLVAQALTEDGYALSEASSGAAGIQKALQEKPDLILLDVMMPGMNGYEVCRYLRDNPRTANIPVIMLTALGNTSDRVHGLDTGADDYIAKPFMADELRARVKAHLRRSSRDLSASPLTNLPGNKVIEQVIAARLERQRPMAVLYFDLNDFKAYNDEYGWIKGDVVIQTLARFISEAVDAEGTPNDFIGHVGGDDFIVVSTPDRAERIARRVIAQFDAEIPECYSAEARDRGYIEAEDRKGHRTRVPIMGVSIAIISSEQRKFQHPTQIAAHAAEVKKYVKTLSGSQYAFDRRTK